MSHHSGFSSASRLAIDRLNQEAAEKDKRLAAMEAMLAANGLLVQQPHLSAYRSHSQAPMAMPLTDTPSRKRHLSQQPERAAKIHGFSNGTVERNRFELLTQESYPDTSTRPGSEAQHANVQLPRSAWLTGQTQPARQGQSLDLQRTQRGQLKGTFNVNNEKEMRQEIEIALESMNGEQFRGSLTRQEVKFQIYKDCLGFTDFSNFDGVRFGHKGCPIIIIKFIEAINVDELFAIQHFDFRRKSSAQGRSRVDIIKCKIRGLRPPGGQQNYTPVLSKTEIDDGVRTIKIDGCDYRIPEETLVEFLSFFGTIVSEIMEDTFDDGIVTENSGGNNRTGIYSVTIRLGRDIPQILPIMGRRIKIHYRGIQKLCPNCFGPHPKQVCHSERIQWNDYVANFKKANPNIPEDLFGKWFGPSVNTVNNSFTAVRLGTNPVQREAGQNVNAVSDQRLTLDVEKYPTPIQITNHSTPSAPVLSNLATIQPNQVQCTSKDVSDINKEENNCEPKKSDFLVPETKAEEEIMIDKLIQAGSLLGEAEQIVASRKLAFNRACREFKKASVKPSKWVTKGQKGRNKKSKQGSHVDPMDVEYEN